MARRIAIGVAWWLAVAYGLQMAAFIYGLPMGVAPIAAIPFAVLVAMTRPSRLGRPKDLRRTYQPQPDAPVVGAEPSSLTGR